MQTMDQYPEVVAWEKGPPQGREYQQAGTNGPNPHSRKALNIRGSEIGEGNFELCPSFNSI